MSHPLPIIFLNAIHSELADLYEPQAALAEHYRLPIEAVHKGLDCFEVDSFAEAYRTDKLCDSITRIEEDLLQIERDHGATLAELAQGHRIVLLIENFEGQPHIEFAMALCLFIAAMSRQWPDILAVQLEDPDGLHISQELCLRDVLTTYSTTENRQVISPRQRG